VDSFFAEIFWRGRYQIENRDTLIPPPTVVMRIS
jgi:hypothetical protein